jgi:hypothetical protein
VDRYWYALGDRIGILPRLVQWLVVEPYYVMWELPRSDNAEFVLITTVQLKKLNDLISSAAKGMDAVLQSKRNE